MSGETTTKRWLSDGRHTLGDSSKQAVSCLDWPVTGPYKRGQSMKLYSGKIPVIGAEIVRALVNDGDIAVIDRGEAELDVQAVLKEYLRLDKEITEKAKDLLSKRNLPYEQFGKVKRAMASEKSFGLGDEALDWMTNQMIESFMQSAHIEEVFVEDTVLRRKMADILKRHMMVDDELDAEVRRRIKNLEEGTSTWDVEYQKALEQIKRNRGLE
jgi:hypothetical protein